MKLCQDCRFAHRDRPAQPELFWFCGHPSAVVIRPPSLLTGRTLPRQRLSCLDARIDVPERCGPDAKFFEPIDESEPRRWPEDIEDAFAADIAAFEWTMLSPAETGLACEVWVCDIKPIVAVTQPAGLMPRADINRLYRWLKLNAEALDAAQSGAIDTAELGRLLRRLP